MKNLYMLCFIFLTVNTFAQTNWTGPKITFTKADNADWTLEANQDRITNNVWITRANRQSIFNIADAGDTTAGNCSGVSPYDTEWAYGTIADGVGTLTFSPFLNNNFAACSPPSVVGNNAVLHLITDNIYIDIKFLSWSQGNSGGGFSYERSTDPALGVSSFELATLSVFPNPASSSVSISGLNTQEQYTIYTILGKEVKTGTINNTTQIDISALNSGLYFLKLKSGKSLKFLKT